MKSGENVLRGVYTEARIIEEKDDFLIIQDSFFNNRVLRKNEVENRYFSSENDLKSFINELGLEGHTTDEILELIGIQNEKHLINVIGDLFESIKKKSLFKYNFLIVESILLIIKNTSLDYEDSKKFIVDTVSYFINMKDVHSLAELLVFSIGSEICQEIISALIYYNDGLFSKLIKRTLILEKVNNEKLRIESLRFMILKLIMGKKSYLIFSEISRDAEFQKLVSSLLLEYADKDQEVLRFCIFNQSELGFSGSVLPKGKLVESKSTASQVLVLLLESMHQPNTDLAKIDKLILLLNERSAKGMGLYRNANCIEIIKNLAKNKMSRQLIRVAKIAELTTFKSLIANIQPIDDETLVAIISCCAIEGMSLTDLNRTNFLKYLNQGEDNDLDLTLLNNSTFKDVLKDLSYSEVIEIYLNRITMKKESNLLNFLFGYYINKIDFQEKIYCDKDLIKLVGSRLDLLRVDSYSILPSLEVISESSIDIGVKNFIDIYHVSVSYFINSLLKEEMALSDLIIKRYSEIFDSIKAFFIQKHRIRKLLDRDRIEYYLKSSFGIISNNQIEISRSILVILECFFTSDDHNSFIEYLNDRRLSIEKLGETLKSLENTKLHCDDRTKDLLDSYIVTEEKKRYQSKKPSLLKKTVKSDETTSKLNIADISHLFKSYPGKTSNYEKLSKEELHRIKEVIEKRRIPFLVHFTRIENLASILRYGLVPVERHEEMNITSIRNDENRIDERLDCTSISVGFPNYKLFYSFRNQQSGSRWVIIFIKRDLLYNNDNYAYFCKTNAARVCSGRNNLGPLRKSNSLENMFCQSIVYNDDYRSREITRDRLNIPDFYPTDPQAEVLIGNTIKVQDIAWIGFQNGIDMKYFCEELGKEFFGKFIFRVAPGLFEPRSDYRFWRKDL